MNVLVDGQTLATPDVRRGIGRVLVQLCEELVPSDRTRRWYFAVRSESDLEELGEEAQRFAIPLVVPELSNERDAASKSRAYSESLLRLAAENDIGVYWNPNPLMPNVVLPLEFTAVRNLCTVYDLIPRMLSRTHRDPWPRHVRDDYDHRVKRLPAWADHMVFISNGSRDDYCGIDSTVEARSSVAHLGVDHANFWAPVTPDPSQSDPYVLLVGGEDPRKNLAQAIVAFAAARARQPKLAATRLAVVGSSEGAFRDELLEIAAAHEVGDCLRFHDFVEDADLACLYRRAAVFFFPSLYEGFGLPVVEAMACGAPTVISDRPELRECAGDWAYTCDPTSVDSMADALVEALTNDERNRKDREQIVQRARRFDWARSAAAYAEVFDRLATPASRAATPARRLRVAWVSPWPPSRTGVADYSAELCEALRSHIDLDLFVDNPQDVDPSFDAYGLAELRERSGDYDSIVYHLGNNSEHHTQIYRLAWDVPGIVVMHDFNIHPFLHQAYLGKSDEWLYRDALSLAHGGEGREHFADVQMGRVEPDIFRYPLSPAIAARSRGVIVHSAWARDALGPGVRAQTIPLFGPVREPRAPEALSRLRERLDLDPDRFVIGVFGFLNAQKRIPAILEACARLRERGYPLQLVLVGSKIDEHLDLPAHIAAHGASDFTRHTGYVPDDEFWDFLDACDAVLNLRFPTMGESSLSLSRALGSGKPCIVTDIGQFAEIPDAVCWKAEAGPGEVDQIVAYLEELLGDPDLREQLGDSARRFTSDYASKERAAGLYASAIARFSA